MKKAIYFLAICLALSGCKAFQPSANLNHFSNYFAAPMQDSTNPVGQIKVTFFGTSTLLFDDGKSQIMVDGFFSRPSVSKVAFGKIRSNEKLIKTIIQQYHLERLKAIFVCHSHYDHAMDAPLLCKLTGAKLYGSSSTLNLGKGEKLADDAMRFFEPGKKISIGAYSVTIVNSKHTPPFKLFGKSNATDPHHPNIDAPLRQPAHAEKYIEGGTFDVYIEHNNKRFLVKASTNYLAGALQFYPCDVLFLGTAMLGIQPADFQQQYYDETVKATGAKMVIPIHWDNFMRPLSKPLVALPNISDNVEAGLQFLLNKTKAEHVDFRLLQKESSILF
jgi:L-ascorbate metabolism protein UlaG (beta-lactamase superfamily)